MDSRSFFYYLEITMQVCETKKPNKCRFFSPLPRPLPAPAGLRGFFILAVPSELMVNRCASDGCSEASPLSCKPSDSPSIPSMQSSPNNSFSFLPCKSADWSVKVTIHKKTNIYKLDESVLLLYLFSNNKRMWSTTHCTHLRTHVNKWTINKVLTSQWFHKIITGLTQICYKEPAKIPP